MDEHLIQFILTGVIAGFAGGLVNVLLWVRTFRHTKIFGIKIHNGFINILKNTLGNLPKLADKNNFKKLEERILNLFDDFMSTQLVEKMPVLKMFIDEKLIAEIRTVFRQEMEIHLPNLLKENIASVKNIAAVTTIFENALTKGLRKYKWNTFIYLIAGMICGGLAGIVIWYLFK